MLLVLTFNALFSSYVVHNCKVKSGIANKYSLILLHFQSDCEDCFIVTQSVLNIAWELKRWRFNHTINFITMFARSNLLCIYCMIFTHVAKWICMFNFFVWFEINFIDWFIHHSRADDMQLHMPAPNKETLTILHSMQKWVNDVKTSTTANVHKNIDNKTEVMLITSKRTKPLNYVDTSISIDNFHTPLKQCVINVGLMFLVYS